MPALLSMLNHQPIQKGFIASDKPIKDIADLERRIFAYHDPLSPHDLRVLVNLWAAYIALKNERRDYMHFNILALISAFAQTHDFDRAAGLVELLTPVHHNQGWTRIAEAQAKIGLLEAALETAGRINHSERSNGDYSEGVLNIAKEMAAKGDTRAEATFRQASQVRFGSMFVRPPHAHPEPRFFYRLCIALAEAGSYDFAIEMAAKIRTYSRRASAQCFIAEQLFKVDMARARKLLKSTLRLIYRPEISPSNRYEPVMFVSPAIILCAVAQTLYPLDRKYALKLMQRAFTHL